MYIKKEVLKHFETASIPKLSSKTGIPVWKLRYFSKSGGNLYVDEFMRLLLVLGYKLYSPDGEMVYGSDPESIKKAIIANTPKEK